MYIAVAKRQGVAPEKLRGTIQNDILKEYIGAGVPISSRRHQACALITDIFQYCKEYVPNWNTISISGYHIREAGSTAAQEVAFTLANGIAYIEAAVKSGMDVDEFASQLSFFFNAHNNFLRRNCQVPRCTQALRAHYERALWRKEGKLTKNYASIPKLPGQH